MMVCLLPAVSESLSTVSSFLGRSGFESGFAFVGHSWTNNEAGSADFCCRVPFRFFLSMEILLSFAMVMCILPAVDDSSSTKSFFLRRYGFESGFDFFERT